MNNFRTIIFGFFLLSVHPSLASWQDLPDDVKKRIMSSISATENKSATENILLCGSADTKNNKIMREEVLKDLSVRINASVINNDTINIINKIGELHVIANNCTKETLQWINQCTNTKSLSLTGTKVRDIQLTFIQNLKELKELNLSKTALNNQGFVRLENFSKLEILDVSDTVITDTCLDQVFNYPKKLPNLRQIDICNTKACKFRTASSIEKWNKSRPNLKFVSNFVYY
jgi:hypothetical protein